MRAEKRKGKAVIKVEKLPKRKQIRIPQFDYSSNNYYYVTICTSSKAHLFGMGNKLTPHGKIAEKYLLKIPEIFIMPNHIHAILVFERSEAARMYACPTLGTVIGNYKAAVTREIHSYLPGFTVWQKRYYDHVIRNAHDYENIWTYIDDNPFKWEADDYY